SWAHCHSARTIEQANLLLPILPYPSVFPSLSSPTTQHTFAVPPHLFSILPIPPIYCSLSPSPVSAPDQSATSPSLPFLVSRRCLPHTNSLCVVFLCCTLMRNSLQ